MCVLCALGQSYDPARHPFAEFSAAASEPPAYAGAAGTLDQLADFLTTGYWASQGYGPRAFDTSVSNIITVNVSTISAAAQQLALWALDAWESVADLEFQVVTGAADLTFQDTDSGAYGGSSYSGGIINYSYVNISQAWIDSYGSTLGSYGFQTFVHEIGHALGLGHQGAYNGSASYATDATFGNDSWQASVMSYFSQAENTLIDASYAYVLSPMMADILAIQNLYGAAGTGSATAGNTTWGEHTTLDSYMELYFDTLGADGTPDPAHYSGNTVTYTIYDAGGTDVLDFGSSTYDDHIDLTGGTYSDVYGMTGNIGISTDTVIENAITGSGDDWIGGNGAGNVVTAGTGNDVVRGHGGADEVWAGTGNDIVTTGPGNDTQFLGAGDDLGKGYGGADTIYGGDGFDTLVGGDGADELWGGDDNDTLFGRDGDDRLYGDTGDDLLRGGADDDLIFGGTGADTLKGETGNDTLNGGDGADRLFGSDGDDRLAGDGGNDTLTGGDGADVFVFTTGGGNDLVRDFDLAGGDGLELDDALWSAGYGTLTASQVVDLFASVGTGDVVFTFDGGESFSLAGLSDTTGLDTILTIV